jgi:hypothetical protein
MNIQSQKKRLRENKTLQRRMDAASARRKSREHYRNMTFFFLVVQSRTQEAGEPSHNNKNKKQHGTVEQEGTLTEQQKPRNDGKKTTTKI